MDTIESLKKLAAVAEKSQYVAIKVAAGLFLADWAYAKNYQMYKAAAGQEEATEAQIFASNAQANPVAGVVAQYMLRQPPSNLNAIVELFAKKLEQDLRNTVSAGPIVGNPMKTENEQLKLMLENMQLKMQAM